MITIILSFVALVVSYWAMWYAVDRLMRRRSNARTGRAIKRNDDPIWLNRQTGESARRRAQVERGTLKGF